ncbi:MAG: tRNA pseudouridine(55) synthase TruB [Alphaproteobacteria bacterium]
MARHRRRAGRAINGWLNVDKPVGITSAACVERVREITEASKLGHAGTLDPLASGVLPIALGEATKLMPYLLDAPKEYRFTVKWGERRSTDDAEGEIVETCDLRPTTAAIAAALPDFLGEIMQVPPAYSAIKIGGKRAYALARAGEVVELEARPVRIDSIELLGASEPDRAELYVVCRKGAYMRSLARDLAARLGTCGHLLRLRRSGVGPFREANAISLELLAHLGHIPGATHQLLPIETALDDIPALAISARDAARLRRGQAVPVMDGEDRQLIREVGDEGIVLAKQAATPVALARVDGIQIRPVRVLNV